MKYYKDTNGQVYAYSQTQVDLGHVKTGLTKLTAKQVGAHLNPPPNPEDERARRDWLLSQLDIAVSNPLRFATLTPEQISELADYRQLLLDVPQQTSFPISIEWPVMPDI